MIGHLWSLVRSSCSKCGAHLECPLHAATRHFPFGHATLCERLCILSLNSKSRDEHTHKLTRTHTHTSTIQWRPVAIIANDDDTNCDGGVIDIAININCIYINQRARKPLEAIYINQRVFIAAYFSFYVFVCSLWLIQKKHKQTKTQTKNYQNIRPITNIADCSQRQCVFLHAKCALRLLVFCLCSTHNQYYYVINMRTHAIFLRAVCTFVFQSPNFNSLLHFI